MFDKFIKIWDNCVEVITRPLNESSSRSIDQIDRIIFNKEHTILIDNFNDKTIVTCQEGCGVYNKRIGYLMVIAKYLASNKQYSKLIELLYSDHKASYEIVNILEAFILPFCKDVDFWNIFIDVDLPNYTIFFNSIEDNLLD